MAQEDQGKLELLAHKSFPANNDLVRVIDFLNKNLKAKNIMFGITKDLEKDQMTINIYEF